MSKKNYKKPAGARDMADKKEEVNLNKEEVARSAKSYWEKKYEKPKEELLYGKQHFIIIGTGIALLFLGFFLMSGGSMPDENTWDPKVIYSFTRITLATIFVLVGLGTVGFAIFYNSPSDKTTLEKLSENATEQE